MPRGDTAVPPRGDMGGPPRGDKAVALLGDMEMLPIEDWAFVCKCISNCMSRYAITK